MPIYDLSEKLKTYGTFHIKAQSLADGYENSDFAELTYSIGPTIAIKSGVISIVAVIEGITAFDVYVDGVKKGQAAYDYSADWGITAADYLTTEEDGKHVITLCAIGDGVADNRSNAVTCYKGTAPIYGVTWTNDTTTTMERTDDAVGLSYAIQASDGSIASDFNDTFPWNETAVLTLEAGDFLRMPEMYFRIGTDDNGDINAVAVSKNPSGDGDWFKVDPFYYGIYGASANGSGLASLTGKTRLANTSRPNFRTRARATGAGYYQLDLYHKTVMTFLWWIEWATKNSESIMPGKTSATGSSPCQTGGTDQVSTPSGFNTATKQMRYHYIEDFVGNFLEWIDGVSGMTNSKVWVSSNPDDYADTNGPANYKQPSYNTTGSGNCIKAFGWDAENPFLCYFSKTTGSQNWTQAFCDGGWAVSSSFPVVYSGACWYYSSAVCGLCFCSNAYAGGADSGIGGRLLYNP